MSASLLWLSIGKVYIALWERGCQEGRRIVTLVTLGHQVWLPHSICAALSVSCSPCLVAPSSSALYSFALGNKTKGLSTGPQGYRGDSAPSFSRQSPSTRDSALHSSSFSRVRHDRCHLPVIIQVLPRRYVSESIVLKPEQSSNVSLSSRRHY